MTTQYKRLLKVITAGLGLSGLSSVAFITCEMFSTFVLWKLLLILVALPGAAFFLYEAFRRKYPWIAPGFGSRGGHASLGVTWPRPTRPPTLSAAAAEAVPREPEWVECRGTLVAERTIRQTGDSSSVSKE